MPHAELFRSTAFRLAALFTCLFAAGFVAASALTYVLVLKETEQRTDDLVSETRRALVDGYRADGLADLVAGIARRARATDEADRVYLLLAPDGRHLAGNVSTGLPVDGSVTVTGTALGLDEDTRYRVASGHVDGLYLLVGSSLDDVEDVSEILFAALGWSSLCVAGIALSGGLLLALRTQRRIGAITTVLDRAAAGDLGSRIHLSNSRDDLDRVSGRINAALERVQDLVQALKQVSDDIAHDLKTPIARLQITIEQARTAGESGRDVASLLMQAEEETRTINGTFEALLRIAQIESGSRRERFARVDLGEILTTLAEAYSAVAEDAGHSLTLHAPASGTVALEGDRELLIQMFSNLIENAIRHCAGGARIEIEAVRCNDGSVIAAVGDNGSGIPPAERENVLRRLYRLEKSRTTPGSGLGLSTVKAIAVLHHAEIALRDNAPGLRVELIFPGALR